ncbi:MAG: chemotaxis protein CheB [Phycisphaerales bacterium]
MGLPLTDPADTSRPTRSSDATTGTEAGAWSNGEAGSDNQDHGLPEGSIEPAPTSDPSPPRTPPHAPTPGNRGVSGTSEHALASPSQSLGRVPCVVGIGASAGGLAPLEDFFASLPERSGVAFVVVQHLSPDFKSLMKELLSRHTNMAVHRVEGDTPVSPDTVYLIPPGQNMRIEGGVLKLEAQDRSPGHHPLLPIDRFFEALANDLGDRAVAIVLSGTGSDGTQGIRRIGETGGLVLVQDPETAEFDGMPRSAIATEQAHFVQPPDQLARTIYEYALRLDVAGQGTIADGPLAGEHAPNQLAGQIEQVIGLLRTPGGMDFACYKSGTLARRIQRRMLIAGHEDFDQYVRVLAEDSGERTALRNDLLIGVTAFFRDPHAWAALERHALPRLVAEAHGPLRVWVTACSTGEEVYTLAMLLTEEMERQGKRPQFKIFATDVDARAIERASAGVYPAPIAADVGEERLARYFVPAAGGFRVNRELRGHAIFSTHNLTTDAPFTRLDLVTCRNVLIYMQHELQMRLLASLHFGLRHRGVLLLGSAESTGDLENEFEVVDGRWKIYAKKHDVVLPVRRRQPAGDPMDSLRRRVGLGDTTTQRRNTMVLSEAHRLLLKHMGGMCLTLGDGLELMHAFGQTTTYLRVPEGGVQTDVSTMLLKDLVLPLRTATHRAESTGEPIAISALSVDTGTAEQPERTLIDLTVERVSATNLHPAFYLALITPHRAQIAVPDEDGGFDVDKAMADRISGLETELQRSRENLQATIEELETTNEEQQASNEELVAANEELQSTNEELHSVNEELYTVNAEYQAKNLELAEVYADLENLLRSTDVGVLFLDQELVVRSFTPRFARYLPIREADVGRPISELAVRIGDIDLAELARAAASDGVDQADGGERVAIGEDGTRLQVKVLPYLRRSGTDQGLVVTLVDVTELSRATEDANQARQLVERIYRHSPAMLQSIDAEGRLIRVSKAWCETLGYTEEDVIGRPSVDFLTPASREYALREVLPRFQETGHCENVRYQMVKKDGGIIDVLLTANVEIDDHGELHETAAMLVDVTEAERIERESVRIRRGMEQAMPAYARVGADGLYEDVNDAHCALIGHPRDALIGTSWLDIIDEDDHDRMAEALALLEQQDTADIDVYVRRPDGSTICKREVLVAIRDASGACVGHHRFARDITEQKRLEQDLTRANRELERKNREMEEFVYTISHDLKSPLVTISGLVGFIRKLLANGEHNRVPDLALSVEETTLRMREKIEDLLELSRLGRSEAQQERVDLREVVLSVLHEHRNSLARMGADISVDELPTVVGDPRKLARVFEFLVINAMKHAQPAGTLQLTIEPIGRPACDAGEVGVRVRDNGVGVDSSHQERIFELFSRGKTNAEGAGIGLALVRRVMDLHGGRVWTEPADVNGGDRAHAPGASFCVAFPCPPPSDSHRVNP